jgi:hypothetical protein
MPGDKKSIEIAYEQSNDAWTIRLDRYFRSEYDPSENRKSLESGSIANEWTLAKQDLSRHGFMGFGCRAPERDERLSSPRLSQPFWTRIAHDTWSISVHKARLVPVLPDQPQVLPARTAVT